MSEEPDIIKELRNDERKGLLSRARVYTGKSSKYSQDHAQMDFNDKLLLMNQRTLQPQKSYNQNPSLDGSDYKNPDRTRKFLSSMGDVILFLDGKGTILEYSSNESNQDIFHLNKGSIGNSFKDTFPEQFASQLHTAIINMNDTRTVEQFDYSINSTDQPIWFNVKVTLDRINDTCSGYFVFIQDVTKIKDAEDELSSNKTRLNDLIEQAPISIQILDPTGKTKQVNPAWERLWNVRLEDLEEYNILHDERLRENGVLLYLQRAFNGEIVNIPPIEYSAEETLGKGSVRWVSAIAYPVLDNEGNVKEVTLIHQDITESKNAEKKLNAEQKKLLSVFDGIDEAIYVADTENYNILYLNEPSIRNWGDRIGEKCYTVLQNRDSPCPFCTNKLIKRDPGKSYIWEFQNTINRQWYRCIDRLIPWPDGRKVRFEMAIDITEIKRSHEELKDAHEAVNAVNKELKRKVEQKTEDINELVKQKDDFIHMLGHDLKNPMTPILTLLPIINQKIEDSKSKDMMQHVIQNTRRMKDIIDETLKLARLDDVSRTIDPVDICLPEEIKEIIDENQTLFDRTNFKVEMDVEKNCHVFYDKHQFYDLVSNLVNNAVKYTPDSSDGILRIHSQCEDDEIVLSFKDSGAGMTEEQVKQVFDKFYKAGTPREGMNSSGLGLSICKTIVEKHGGRIWVESEGLGKGSIFYVSIRKEQGGK